jgi:hypothetical protein
MQQNTKPRRKKSACYKMLHRISEPDGTRTDSGPCEHATEPSGSIKGGEFFD